VDFWIFIEDIKGLPHHTAQASRYACVLAECRSAPFAHAHSGFTSNAVFDSLAILLAFSGCENPLQRVAEFAGSCRKGYFRLIPQDLYLLLQF
jgi:hypothetical protein